MTVRWRTAAEEAEGLSGGDLVPRAGRNEDGVAGGDGAGFAVDLDVAVAFENKVEFFAEPVVVALGGLANGDGGFGEALVLHRGVRAVEDAADGAAVFGGEGGLRGKRIDGHGERLFFMSGGSKGKLAGRKDAVWATWTGRYVHDCACVANENAQGFPG